MDIKALASVFQQHTKYKPDECLLMAIRVNFSMDYPLDKSMEELVDKARALCDDNIRVF